MTPGSSICATAPSTPSNSTPTCRRLARPAGTGGRTLGSYGFYQDCTPEEGLRKLTEASDKDDAEWAALGGDVLAEVTRSVARSLGFAGQDATADADPEEATRIVRGRRRGTYMYKSA
jgi:hypothetical protein